MSESSDGSMFSRAPRAAIVAATIASPFRYCLAYIDAWKECCAKAKAKEAAQNAAAAENAAATPGGPS